jgi:DNA-binding transcriptional LysR family regulator
MKTNIDWDKYKTFYYVAKAGSFTAAGEILNLSQSALSRSIQNLEYQVGMKLLERIPRGVILTKQGEGLFKAAEKALEVFTHAEMLMLEQEEEQHPLLLQVCPIYWIQRLLQHPILCLVRFWE